MSGFQLRQSKFRHVFGKPLKKTDCYDNIRITKTAWDSTFCAVNPKYVAIITESAGGGAFLVLPLNKPGRIERDAAKVAGHKAAVLDIAWCPWHDDVIASGSEDCTVKIWQIPDGGLRTDNLDEPIVDLVAHQRRVGLVIWHPTANNVLLSAGSDNKVFIWNVGTAEVLTEIEFPDICLCASFNSNGSLLATTCKDKILRIIDPRKGEVIKEGDKTAHEGSKPSQCAFLANNKVFTTGFSRMSERQYALWDVDDLNTPLVMEEIDTSNGVMFPFYDGDTNMVYLAGKGDSCIRYFEITPAEPYVYYLSMYQSGDPQRGICMMPKRGVNVNGCEITRFYKLHTKGLCEIIPMTVPRKSELFQDDLYPDCVSDMPAVSAEDWFAGVDTEPLRMSLKAKFEEISKTKGTKTRPKSTVLSSKMPSKLSAAATPAAPALAPIAEPAKSSFASSAPIKREPEPARPAPAAAPAPAATHAAAPAEPDAPAQSALPPSSRPPVDSPKPKVDAKKPDITSAKPPAVKTSSEKTAAESSNDAPAKRDDDIINKLVARIEAMETKMADQEKRIDELENCIAAKEEMSEGVTVENGSEEEVV